MKVGIISDTHNARKNVLKAIKVFNEKEVSYVFHAGDMVSLSIAGMFAELEGAKLIAVYGNCDSDREVLKDVIENFEGQVAGETYQGQIDGRKIFMRHRPAELKEIIGSGNYDLVIHGHTHKLNIRKVGGTLVISPGTARHEYIGKSQVVIVELDDMSTEVVSLG